VKENEEEAALPFTLDPEGFGVVAAKAQYLGAVEGHPCFCAETNEVGEVPEGFCFRGLRELFGALGEDYFRIAGRASQIVDWDRDHRFCGRCGKPTLEKEAERAKECPVCGLVVYPRISPAVIVAVVRDGRLLLARSARFPRDFFSVLAGFVDPGETLEECIHREVREEVGIEVGNLRYFGSQPWPFPNSLMIAFTAEYACGEISIDGKEIQEAAWYGADELPKRIPGAMSVSRKLIDWFAAGRGGS
jgi:NAD+ diphosphatase